MHLTTQSPINIRNGKTVPEKGTIIYSAAGEKIAIYRFWGAALGRSAMMSKLS